MVQEKLPIIRLTLGDEFTTIQNQSAYDFKRAEFSRFDLILVDTPSIFQYARPDCEFALPPALSFSSAIDNGHATNAVVSPHLSYLTQNEAIELIENLSRLFEESGWKIRKHYFSLEQVKRTFADPKTDSDYTIRVREWQCGDDELYIQIERHWREGESLPQLSNKQSDLYVVTVKIENDKVRAEYSGTER